MFKRTFINISIADKRPENDNQWPRIVRPVLKRSKHVICHMCTASGKLEEHIFTKWKNGRFVSYVLNTV